MKLLLEGQLKVDLVVERQWHVGMQASALEKIEALGAVYGGFPSYRYRKLGISSSRLRTHPFPALWNEVCRRFSFLNFKYWDEAKSLAYWVAAQKNLSPFITCYATAYQFLFPLLKDRNKILILERGSTHPENFFYQIEKGKEEAGLPFSRALPQKIKEEIEAGKLAHFVVSPSLVVTESYVTRGFDPERILTIPYGVDHSFFSYKERSFPSNRPLRIACVGILGIRKGIGRLLKIGEWLRSRNLNGELWLIGPLEEEARILLQKTKARYRLLGVKKGLELVEAFHACDLYCLPSYEEGFGISVLEAMATGLPVILSEEVGAKEAVAGTRAGVILQTFEEKELDEKISPLLENFEERRERGKIARQQIEKNYTVSLYQKILEAEYKRMLSIVNDAGNALDCAWRA